MFLSFADHFSGHPAENNQEDEDLPSECISVGGNGKVIADHDKDHGNSQKRIVFGTQLGLRAKRPIESFPGGRGRNHFALGGENSEPNIGSHNRPEHRSNMDVGRARTEHAHQSPGQKRNHQQGEYSKDCRRPAQKRPRRQIVDEPTSSQYSQSDGYAACLRDVGNVGVNESAAGIVDENEQHHSAQPGHQCFPAKPLNLFGSYLKGSLSVDGVEAATVDHPYRRARAIGGGVLREPGKLAVEPGEIVSLADPHDGGKNMEPAHQQVQPFPD